MQNPNLNHLEEAVDHVLRENPEHVDLYHAGRENVFAILMGKIMKYTKGKADILPIAKQVLQQKLDRK